MKHYISTLTLLLCVTFSVYSQPVHIPDPNLRAAVRGTLNLHVDIPINQSHIRRLTSLDAGDLGITDLTGLEFANNLSWLSIAGNPIIDFGPISGLTKLTSLYMWWTQVSDLTPLANLTKLRVLLAADCDIADIRPLANLTHLQELSVGWNQISDISPLANLTELTSLEIQSNQISDISALSGLTRLTHLSAHVNQIRDVRPLAGLTALQTLHIENNRIIDHSPLDGLALAVFTYDQTCDMPPLPLQPRLENRSFPSVFAAWGGLGWSSVLNQPHLSDLEQMAQHDLYWCCLMFGGDLVDVGDAMVIRGSLDSMVQVRDDYIAQNPNMIFLVELRAMWDDLDTFPPDSDYWLRDEGGEIVPVWDMGALNLNHPDLQKRLIDQAVAVSKCGLLRRHFL